MTINDKRALLLGSFNLGLILFGLIFLFLTAERFQQGEILALIGLLGAMVTTIIFLVHKYREATVKSKRKKEETE
mgnify:FL=1